MAVAVVGFPMPPTTIQGLKALLRVTMEQVAEAVDPIAREAVRMVIEEPRGSAVIAAVALGTLAATLGVTRIAQMVFS